MVQEKSSSVRRFLSYGAKLNRSNVYKRTTFLISGLRFTYKFVIPDIKTKQNITFIFIFWNIGQSSHDFNKSVIKAKMHAKIIYIFFWSFLYCIKIQYDFLALRDLAVCMKTKVFFLNRVFLIPDLYFYDIKIQTNLSLNDIKKSVGKSQIKKKHRNIIIIKKNTQEQKRKK
jgi:hypothetical protein